MSLGLYRTFKSNYIPYFANGSGRDRYILYNNAGFFHNNPKSLSPTNIYKTGTFFGTKIVQHNKTDSIKAPNFHYHANGTGRDKYILVDGGGLYSDIKPLKSYKLSDFLRKNENLESPKKPRVKITLSKGEILYNKLLRDKEKNVIKRLYENEKRKFLKKNKTDIFNLESIKVDNNYYNNEIKMEKCLTSRHEKSNFNKLLPYNLKAFNLKEKDNNKDREYENDLCLPSFTERTSRNFYSDLKKINLYKEIKKQNKNLLKFKKLPYFHIVNEFSKNNKK